MAETAISLCPGRTPLAYIREDEKKVVSLRTIMAGTQVATLMLFCVINPSIHCLPNWFHPLTNPEFTVVRCSHEFLMKYGKICMKFPVQWDTTSANSPSSVPDISSENPPKRIGSLNPPQATYQPPQSPQDPPQPPQKPFNPQEPFHSPQEPSHSPQEPSQPPLAPPRSPQGPSQSPQEPPQEPAQPPETEQRSPPTAEPSQPHEEHTLSEERAQPQEPSAQEEALPSSSPSEELAATSPPEMSVTIPVARAERHRPVRGIHLGPEFSVALPPLGVPITLNLPTFGHPPHNPPPATVIVQTNPTFSEN